MPMPRRIPEGKSECKEPEVRTCLGTSWDTRTVRLEPSEKRRGGKEAT